MGDPAGATCPVCGGADLRPFFDAPGMPVFCNALHPDRESARAAPRGDIRLSFCPACTHIHNRSFDPALTAYDTVYENSLHYSGRFNAYAEELAGRLIERYDVRGREVIELGCGKGEFLALLCEKGGNRGLGFDPTFAGDDGRAHRSERMTVVKDLYSEKYADHGGDLICCRHVLEHVPDPRAFLANLRKVVGDRPEAVLYFEVPNTLFILKDLSTWDILYEHCAYFTLASFTAVFRAAGFEVLDAYEAFDGQFLGLEARPGPVTEAKPDPDDVAGYVERFAQAYAERRETWRRNLDGWRREGGRVALWGAGSKGVMFLNAVGAGDEVGAVVDLNPHKHGMFIPGTGHPVVGPEALKALRPETVIVMNRIYADEIARDLERMGVAAEMRFG